MGTEATPDAAPNYLVEGNYEGFISSPKGTDNEIHHSSEEDFVHHLNHSGRGNITKVSYVAAG